MANETKNEIKIEGKPETKGDVRSEAKAVQFKAKDSVFTDLFRIKKNLLELYRTIHPEDTEATEDALTDVTIRNIIMNGEYNDLGFLCGNRYVIMVECQATWSVNIIVRALLYLADTYRKYFEEHSLNLHDRKKVELPIPEIYVLYIGERKDKPEEITLSEEFFDGQETSLEVRVRMLYGENEDDIIGQYVAFTKVYDEQRKKYGRSRIAIRETIRICKERDLLKEYLEARELEVTEMVDLLDDEETIRRIHDASLAREVEAEVTERVTEQVTERVTKSVTKQVTKQVTKKEREHGARALVEMCKKLGGSLVDATESIVSNFGISEQEAGALVQKYW